MGLWGIFPLLLAVSLFLLLLFMELKKKAKKKGRYFKAAKWVRNMGLFLSTVSILGLEAAGILSFLGKVNIGESAVYAASEICIWEDELYGEMIDPKEFENIEKEIDTDAEAEDAIEEEEESVEKEDAETDITVSDEKDASEYIDSDITVNLEEISGYYAEYLHFCGPYDFDGMITRGDIDNMKLLLDAFYTEEKYLEYEHFAEEEDADIVRDRIYFFDEQYATNHEQLMAEDYFQNSCDRMRLFQNSGNVEGVEQAAISAEGAVECKLMKDGEDYAEWFMYISTSVAEFEHALSFYSDTYYSGTLADLRYRMGKMLYKPAVNLKNISEEDESYSLCMAYIFLEEAFKEGTSKKYEIEIDYYYLLVCVDIAERMPEAEAEEICREAVAAYDAFLVDGENDPENTTYVKYRDNAEDAYEKAKEYL